MYVYAVCRAVYKNVQYEFCTPCRAKGGCHKNLTVPEKLNSLSVLVIDKSAVVAPNTLEVAGVYSKDTDLMTTVTVLACDKDEPTLAEQAFLLNAALGGTDVATVKETNLQHSSLITMPTE